MEHLFPVQYAWLIPLAPLIGAAIAGFAGARYLRGQSHWPIWAGVGLSAVLSLWLLGAMVGQAGHGEGHALGYAAHWYTWIAAGDFVAAAGAWIDPLTAVMLAVVCGIGFLITIFSAGYMKGEDGYYRFFAYLGLFIFAMTLLVMGDNFLLLYLGWEGVGLCSYLLIGYYYQKPAAREAAKKAFIANRVGDLGFGIGIMLIYVVYGTISYFGAGAGTNTGVFERAFDPAFYASLSPLQQALVPVIPFMLMIGAFGKSAQFPLYVWLPDAMEGPTPVSALIHAATMVTAGVYMIARCSVLFVQVPSSLLTIAAVGAFTAIFAATIALRQFDLKKVFAYSTISQLGFMFVAAAVLAPVAAVFHLVTHAFFKALLFLSSGVVMHAMMGELDMRRMSGLKRTLPQTRIYMLLGCLALAGFPLFSGFWSKDEIIVASQHWSYVLYAVLTVTAFLTAYYTFRLYFRVFEGPEMIPTVPADMVGHGHGGTSKDHAHASASAVATGTEHESGVDTQTAHDPHHHPAAAGHGHGHHHHEPALMMIPLLILAVGAVFGGLLNLPFNLGVPAHALGDFLGQSPSFQLGHAAAARTAGLQPDPLMFGQHAEAHEFHVAPLVVGGAVAIAGIVLAYVMHLRDRAKADRLAGALGPITRLLEAKYWVDEIYNAVIVVPLRTLGRAFYAFDQFVVDGLVWLVSFVPQAGGFALKLSTQRGYLQGYAVTMLFGVAVILLIIFL